MPGLVPLTCIDCREWELHTDTSIKGLLERLCGIQGTVSNTRFNEIGKQSGWSYNPNNIIVDETIDYKPASTMMYDWVHTMHTLFQQDIDNLLQALKETNPRNPLPLTTICWA